MDFFGFVFGLSCFVRVKIEIKVVKVFVGYIFLNWDYGIYCFLLECGFYGNKDSRKLVYIFIREFWRGDFFYKSVFYILNGG